MGSVAGKVCDALTGDPIGGARILVETTGGVVGLTHTGPTGSFRCETTEGENAVRIGPLSGYQQPELAVQRVLVSEGKETEVPTFWLAPIPAYTVRIVDRAMQPVPRAVISVLRPAQFGWRVTNQEGLAEIRIASLPPDGVIVGSAEHMSEPMAALFALNTKSTQKTDVQLFPLASVTGRAVTAKGRSIEGAVVGGQFSEEVGADPPWLWRTLAARGGAFTWAGVVPYVPQHCVAATANDTSGRSMSFTLDPGESKDIGNVVVAEGQSASSLLGKRLRWYDAPLLRGVLPSSKDREGKPACVMYTKADNAPMVVESLSRARELLGTQGVLFAVVVEGAYDEDGASLPVLGGRAPTPATTYLIDAAERVTIETFGMPPLHALQRLDGERAP
ncbi:MAG TPA: hypothetical protein ENN80_08435 [Candidatus Hydrogenedentes bacterium]|nr:hypothetical protein [Candidatus Hydrogenedentota bacterium]